MLKFSSFLSRRCGAAEYLDFKLLVVTFASALWRGTGETEDRFSIFNRNGFEKTNAREKRTALQQRPKN